MATQTATRMDDPKAVLSMMAFIKDPALWLITLAGSLLGLAIPIDPSTPGHGAILGLLALLGGFFGKVLQVWLQFRQQRAKEKEDDAARYERLLREEKEEHLKEQMRLLERIEKLEVRLDKRTTGDPEAKGK